MADDDAALADHLGVLETYYMLGDADFSKVDKYRTLLQSVVGLNPDKHALLAMTLELMRARTKDLR